MLCAAPLCADPRCARVSCAAKVHGDTLNAAVLGTLFGRAKGLGADGAVSILRQALPVFDVYERLDTLQIGLPFYIGPEAREATYRGVEAVVAASDAPVVAVLVKIQLEKRSFWWVGVVRLRQEGAKLLAGGTLPWNSVDSALALSRDGSRVALAVFNHRTQKKNIVILKTPTEGQPTRSLLEDATTVVLPATNGTINGFHPPSEEAESVSNFEVVALAFVDGRSGDAAHAPSVCAVVARRTYPNDIGDEVSMFVWNSDGAPRYDATPGLLQSIVPAARPDTRVPLTREALLASVADEDAVYVIPNKSEDDRATATIYKIPFGASPIRELRADRTELLVPSPVERMDSLDGLRDEVCVATSGPSGGESTRAVMVPVTSREHGVGAVRGAFAAGASASATVAATARDTIVLDLLGENDLVGGEPVVVPEEVYDPTGWHITPLMFVTIPSDEGARTGAPVRAGFHVDVEVHDAKSGEWKLVFVERLRAKPREATRRPRGL